DASGMNAPSLIDAGFAPFGPLPAPPPPAAVWVLLLGAALVLPLGGAWMLAMAARGGAGGTAGGRPLAGA
ncbi:MAG TPA: hypothetical protein VHK28_06760, partial [Candidatus Limnocylindria bacterium]|nr:hypothetical protein [Candidatus Limnocylindria bacterium]